MATLTTGAAFQINVAKLYAPVVVLSINDNIKFLETDQTLRKINRFFVISFKYNDDDTFDDYYMRLVEIKVLLY